MGWKGYQYIITQWCLVVLTFLLVLNRLRIQLILHKSRRIWRELFIITAWILYLGVAITDSIMNDLNFINSSDNFAAFNATPRDTKILALKYAYWQAYMYKPSIYCCKFALLCFFSDLAPSDNYPKTAKLIKATWFFAGTGCLGQILYNALACWPFSLNWSPEAVCGYSRAYFYTTWVLHIWSDLLVYITPFFIIWHAQRLSLAKKLGALAMFALGFVNIFIACTILAFSIRLFTSDPMYGAYYFLCTLQQGTAIIIVCMPQLRLRIRRHSSSLVESSQSVSFHEMEKKRRSRDLEASLFDTTMSPISPCVTKETVLGKTVVAQVEVVNEPRRPVTIDE